MKIVGKRRAIDHVNPELGPARLDRMWRAVERSQQPAPKRRLLIASAAAAVLLLAGVGALLQDESAAPEARAVAARGPSDLSSPASGQAATGDVIVSGPKQTALALPDGSHVTLQETSQLTVLAVSPSEVRLRLERGKASYDVVPRAERSFVVDTGDLVLTERPATGQAISTRFFVQIAASEHRVETTVKVERGALEITDRQQLLLARLSAGQTWSRQEPSEPSVPAGPLPVARASEKSSAIEPVNTPAPDAEQLLTRANTARLAGHTLEAAHAYEKLYTRHPRDVRAGLAAFELGRIRLDSLRDARGALSALEFALAHNRGGFVSEDAEALRIDALARLGKLASCRAAVAAFVLAHSDSAHGKRVLQACPGA